MKNGEGDEQFRVIGANGLCGSDSCTRAVLMLDEGSVVRWVLFRERLGSDGSGFVSMMVPNSLERTDASFGVVAAETKRVGLLL
ncbi:hypothetical protein V6N13_034118 [Hibiscus sabdariffa]